MMENVTFGHFCYKAIFELSSTSRIPPHICNVTSQMSCLVFVATRSTRLPESFKQGPSSTWMVRKGESCWGLGGRGGGGHMRIMRKDGFQLDPAESQRDFGWVIPDQVACGVDNCHETSIDKPIVVEWQHFTIVTKKVIYIYIV